MTPPLLVLFLFEFTHSSQLDEIGSSSFVHVGVQGSWSRELLGGSATESTGCRLRDTPDYRVGPLTPAKCDGKLLQRDVATKNFRDRWKQIAELLAQFSSGNTTWRSMQHDIFGEKKPLPYWTWQAFWDGYLQNAIANNVLEGQWRPPHKLQLTGGEGSKPLEVIKRWPAVLEGSAEWLLNDPKSNPFKTNELLKQVLGVDALRFKDCSGTTQELNLDTWINSDSLSKRFKTDNAILWLPPDDIDEEDGPLIQEKRLKKLVNLPGFLEHLNRASSHPITVKQVTINWSNSAGVRHVPLHSDGDVVNLACQVSGVKSWVLFPPEATGELTYWDWQRSGNPSVSQMDPFDLNYSLGCFKHAEKAMPPPLVVNVVEGDCISFPRAWWHTTQSRSRSVSINIEVEGLDDDKNILARWPFKQVYDEAKGWRNSWAMPELHGAEL